MRDKIELLVEETGAPMEEAELALGLSNFDMEEALKLLHARMKDIFVIKGKFLVSHPQMYGLMLFIAHVGREGTQPSFRLRFVFSQNPYLYQTDLNIHWYDFEKAIYRARLSEWCQVVLSQNIEREWEERVASQMARLFVLKESLLAERTSTIGLWLEDLLQGTHLWRVPPKFSYSTNVLTVRQYRQEPNETGLEDWMGRTSSLTQTRARPGDLFLSLRIALDAAENLRPWAGVSNQRLSSVCAGDLRAGDIVNVYVLETRPTALFLAEIFGGYSEAGLHSIEAPIESVWQDSGLTGVRVRFGHAVVGEGTFPNNLRVQAIRKIQKSSLLQRVFGW